MNGGIESPDELQQAKDLAIQRVMDRYRRLLEVVDHHVRTVCRKHPLNYPRRFPARFLADLQTHTVAGQQFRIYTITKARIGGEFVDVYCPALCEQEQLLNRCRAASPKRLAEIYRDIESAIEWLQKLEASLERHHAHLLRQGRHKFQQAINDIAAQRLAAENLR